MKRSTILIKSKVLAEDLAGAMIPVLHYNIFVDGKRFGVACKSMAELQETIICCLIIANPDVSYDVVFDPLRVGSFQCYLPLISK